MKHWYRTLPVKIISFILCVLSLTVTAASIVGAVMMVSNGFYAYSEERILKDTHYNMIYNDAYNIMYHAVNQTDTDYDENRAFSVDRTNLRYELRELNGYLISFNALIGNPNMGYTLYYQSYASVDGVRHFQCLGESSVGGWSRVYEMQLDLEMGLPIMDKYALMADVIHIAYALRYWIYGIGIVSLIVSVLCFILLMHASARKLYTEELYPGPFHRVPIDLLLAAIVAVFLFAAYLITDPLYSGEPTKDILLVVLGVIAIPVALGLCMSIAARSKDRSLFKNTVIWKAWKLLGKILKWIARGAKRIARYIGVLCLNIPFIWRTIILAFCISFVELLVLLNCWGHTVIICWLIEKIILVPIILYAALFLRELQKGGNALAKGDLNYQVDTKMMFWDFKRHGENLNNIAGGMQQAVEERLQSERMKTELITNVSHDIKTPLTSIINYADLIFKEPCASEKHKEYAEVLVRKSEHLKRLLDDLVEISKATTGNLEVDLSPCEAGVLLTQAAGEFEQRCQAANLELITIQPEQSIRIMADSRRIWRVFENLMNNACKYSLPGSRVYLSLEQVNNEARFIFRNTSRTALNISPEELMERFVRGDASRSTEGNGLGLSIAQSLTELQNGKMDITIDGDLFKVILTFPAL